MATQAKTGSRDPKATGHYLRQFGPTGAETAAVHPTRLSSNRGNTYINPLSLVGPEQAARGIIAAFDCRNVSGDNDKPDTTRQPGLLQPEALRVPRGNAAQVPARRARGLLRPVADVDGGDPELGSRP